MKSKQRFVIRSPCNRRALPLLYHLSLSLRGLMLRPCRFAYRFLSYTASRSAFCIRSIAVQAIDKLEEMLNGGMKSGQTNMFGPKEYVQIYT